MHFYLKSPHPNRKGAVRPPPQRAPHFCVPGMARAQSVGGRSVVTSLKGLNVGGATIEKRLGGEKKEPSGGRSLSPQLLCLVTFLQNMIAAR